MKRETKARFWWTLRNWWHYPHMFKGSRIYWGYNLLYHLGFGCRTPWGTWRTRLCDWLEDKARSYEDND